MRRRWCADGTWERREDVGSTCGRIWRGWKTTRREHNEGHLYWTKRVGDTTHAGQSCKFRETLQSDEQYSNSVASLVMRVVRDKTEEICFFCIIQVMLTMTSFVGKFYDMDERRIRTIKEVLDGYREDDARNFWGDELNELVGWEHDSSRLGTLRTENKLESVWFNKKIVMDEQSVKHSVMVVYWSEDCDGSIHVQKVGGWNKFQLCKHKMLED